MSTPSRRRQLMRVYGDKTKRKPTRRDRKFLNPKKKLTKKERQFLNPSTYRVKLAKSRKKRKRKTNRRKTKRRKTKRRKTNRRKTNRRKRRKRRKKRRTRKRRYKVVGGLSDLGRSKLAAMIASGMKKGYKDSDEDRMKNVKFLQGLTSEKQEGEEGLDFDNLPMKNKQKKRN